MPRSTAAAEALHDSDSPSTDEPLSGKMDGGKMDGGKIDRTRSASQVTSDETKSVAGTGKKRRSKSPRGTKGSPKRTSPKVGPVFGNDINAVPGKYRRLIPSANPHWESPRPVREGGPGGKYATSLVNEHEHNGEVSAHGEFQTQLSPTGGGGGQRGTTQAFFEEQLASLQTELRLSRQVADQRLKDLQDVKLKLVRVQTKNTNLKEGLFAVKKMGKSGQKELEDARSALKEKLSKIRRLKAKLKSRRTENKKQTKSVSSLSEKLAAANQQCSDFEDRFNTTVARNDEELRLLQDRVEASERHYGENLGYARRNLEGEKAETGKLKMALSNASDAAALYQRKLERVQLEVKSVQNAARAAADREKDEKQRMKRLWSDTVEKLESENSDLWQQLHFLEVALLEEDLERYNGPEVARGGGGRQVAAEARIVIGRSGSESGPGKRGQTSHKDARKARRRLQKHVNIQEEASKLAAKVRALEMKVVEGRQEQAVTAGRLDYAERRVHELLFELNIRDSNSGGGGDEDSGNKKKNKKNKKNSSGTASLARKRGIPSADGVGSEKGDIVASPSNNAKKQRGRARPAAHRPSKQPSGVKRTRKVGNRGRKLRQQGAKRIFSSNGKNDASAPAAKKSPGNFTKPVPKTSLTSSEQRPTREGKQQQQQQHTFGDVKSHPHFPTKEQLQDRLRKLRSQNKRMRSELAERDELLTQALGERRRLLESGSIQPHGEVHADLDRATRANQRLAARIAGVKQQWFEWQLEFRTELSIHGLFDESEAPHDGTNLTPSEMSRIIQRRVESLVKEDRNSLGNVVGGPRRQPQTNNPSVSPSMLIATPTLVERMSSDIIEGITVDRRDIICDRAVQISGCYVRMTVRRFVLQNGDTVYRISVYDPRECQGFSLNIDDDTAKGLYGNGGTTLESSDELYLVDTLIKRLVLSSVNGKRRLQLGTDRTVAVRGSDPEEEMARLMGTGTQKQELDRIKRDIKQGLEEVDGEVIDPKLVKGAIFTEVKQFNTPYGKQLLTVRLLDELGVDQNSGALVVYCSNQQDGRIRYRLVISRTTIDDLIPGGVDEQGSRRRLCRLILSQLIVKGGIMVLAPVVAEEDAGEEDNGGSGADNTLTTASAAVGVGSGPGAMIVAGDAAEGNIGSGTSSDVKEFVVDSEKDDVSSDEDYYGATKWETTEATTALRSHEVARDSMIGTEGDVDEDFEGDVEESHDGKKEAVVCASCGSSMFPGSVFCTECGAKIEEKNTAAKADTKHDSSSDSDDADFGWL